MPPPGSTSPLRLGLIGCGRLGLNYYMPAIAAAEGVELAALAEPDLGRSLAAREAAAELHGPGVRICPSAKVLLSSSPPEAVVICTSPRAHLEHARLAADAGIPALVEKPPADGTDAAAELSGLEPRPRIAFNRRYAVGREILGALGDVPGPADVTLELSFLRARWRPHTAQPDALDDAGSHLADLALRIAGPAAGRPRVRALRLGRNSAEAEVRIGEVRALLSCAINRPWRERVAVSPVGAPASAWSAGGPLAGLRARLRGAPDPLLVSITAQLEAFARAARGEEDGILATAREGLRVMRLLAAIRASAAGGGGWVEPAPTGGVGAV